MAFRRLAPRHGGAAPTSTRGLHSSPRSGDKFSKWIEARPIVNVRSEEAVSFFTDIIYRFGIPNTIITDNGTQFMGKKILNFCDDNNIRVDWSVVAHPKTNGQVERANSMILQCLKPHIFKRLEKFRARWVIELPSVLWGLHQAMSSNRLHTLLHGARLGSGPT
jgi:transposase InsO family protein